jgi:hypothetical protein
MVDRSASARTTSVQTGGHQSDRQVETMAGVVPLLPPNVSDTIVGYVESGHCGKAEVSISSQHKVTSRESIDPVFCKKSWIDFM